MIKVSDYIARFIAQLGVRHVFTVSGGGNLHLIDSLAARSDVRYVAMHHEQAAAMAAEAYARVTENIGVCCVTFGPAATNTLTGVAGAWLDSIPVLYISGQVRRSHMATGGLRQLGVQEVDIISMVKPITKYAEVVREPYLILQYLKAAIHLATSGRPGPVYLDIPADVQSAMVDEDKLGKSVFDLDVAWGASKGEIEEVIELLQRAKRPLLFAGHGIALAKARPQLAALIERLQIPVVTSMSGHDLIATDHPLFVGRPGVFGDRAGNLAVQNCDLLLSIGVRHCLWNIGYDTKAFARHATKVAVDVDAAELGKATYVPDLAIQADAGLFMDELLERLGLRLSHRRGELGAENSGWSDECRRWRATYPVALPEYAAQTDYVNSYHFTDVLSSLLADDEVVFTGVGTAFTGTLQSIKLRVNQRLHCNVGCASMGYDLPAAIGAAFASGKRVVLLTGDGSLMMNLQELATIAHHKLPVKVFLFNNAGYLAIKNTQRAQFGGRLNAVNHETGLLFPSFRRVADTFGIPYVAVENHEDDMEGVTRWALKTPGPVIVDLNMHPDQPLWPKVSAETLPDGTIRPRDLSDMEPLLPREEYTHNMRHVNPLT